MHRPLAYIIIDKTEAEMKGRAQKKVAKVMHEYGAGKLHSGSKKGPVVTSRKQAIAIGESEARRRKGRKR